jgi:hypothetical protein
MIERNGGSVNENDVEINVQEIKPVRLEVGFEGHYPVERKRFDDEIKEEYSFEFDGIGFALNGSANKVGNDDYVFETEMYTDGKLIYTSNLPTNYTKRKNTLFWAYQLEPGKHIVTIKILNPTDKAKLNVRDAVIYNDKPANLKY